MSDRSEIATGEPRGGALEEAPKSRRWPPKTATAELAVAFGLIFLWTLANGIWLLRAREGQPLNMDESGYLGFAMNDLGGWQRGGPRGWLDTVLLPSPHGPLTTASTSLVALLGVSDRLAAFGVVLAFAGITAAATAGFAHRLAIPGATLTSCLLLLSAPGFVALSRTYVFAVPAAAVTMAALYFLQGSRGLFSSRWAVAFGVAAGLMPLARSMMIAFVPVLFVVALVYSTACALREGDWGRRTLNGVLSAAVAVGVAAIWLIPSWEPVYQYLTDYGYGNHTKDYTTGVAAPLRLVSAMGNDFFLPLLVVVVVGWILLLGHAVGRPADGGPWTRVVALASNPLACCAGFVAGAGLALMSSSNAGFGFAVPLIAPAVVVASAGLLLTARSVLHRHSARWAVFVVTAFCAVAIWPRFDTEGWLAEIRTVQFFGTPVLISSGADTDTAYPFTANARDNARGYDLSNKAEWGKRWAQAADTLTADILDGSSTRPDYAFGFRHRYLNVNVTQLRILERLGYGVVATQVDPTGLGQSQKAYVEWLTTGAAATSCHLLVSAGTVNEAPPAAMAANLKAAARQTGFAPTISVALPDGRVAEVWEREGVGC